MNRFFSIFTLTLFSLLVFSCANNDATAGLHATVLLRDGTSYSGTVKSTSAAAITLTGDDKSTRTIEMRDVKTIDYGEVAAASPPVEPAPVARTRPVASNISTRTYQLRAGTELSVRTDETIDSKKAVQGQTFAAEVSKDVHDAAGDVVIPRGSNAQIVIRSASKGGRFTGESDLVLDLESVSVDGQLYQLDTTDVEMHGRQGLGKNKRTGEFVGGGALVGTIIGAIAGHGKGAAIGAGSGAAAGVGADLITRGGAVRVPAETVLTFKLDKPLRIHAAR